MPISLIQCIGRGYSDLCAALCGAAMDAQEVQIWKEVDGIFTADPNKVPSARRLDTLTAEEAMELTFFGSEVIHPLTVEQLGFASIPLRIKNVKNPSGPGTMIPPTILDIEHPSGKENISFAIAPGFHNETHQRSRPTAVTVKSHIWLINVLSNGVAKPKAFFNKITERLNHHEITVDLISSSNKSISVAIGTDNSTRETETLLKAVTEMQELGKVTVTKHMAIVSVIGTRMRHVVGVVGEIFQALAKGKINIYLISQGSSEINVS